MSTTGTAGVSLPGDTKDFSTQLSDAKNSGADIIFFGGTSSNGGGIIKKQMADSGLSNVKYLGGDGIVDAEFFTEAGAQADGAYGTVAAPDPTKLDTAAKFVSDYKAAFGVDPGAYSAEAFDVTNAIISVLKGLGSSPTRSAVVQAFATVDYQGLTKQITFGSDHNLKVQTAFLYQVKKGKLAYLGDLTDLTK